MLEPTVQLNQLQKVEDLWEKGKRGMNVLTEGLSDFQKAYLIHKGAYSILAHKKSQAKRNTAIKFGLEMWERAQSDPKFAEFVGLGKRVEMSEGDEK